MDGTLMGNGLRAAWRIAVQCMHPLPNWINAAAGKEGKYAKHDSLSANLFRARSCAAY